MDGQCSPAVGPSPGGGERGGRGNPDGLPGAPQSSCECQVTSFIKMFLKKLRNGKINANSGVSLLISWGMETSLVRGGKGCNYSAPDKPQGCSQRRNPPWRSTSVLRASITVKLDYREQLSISDKIINLIFVYFFLFFICCYNHPTLLSCWW